MLIYFIKRSVFFILSLFIASLVIFTLIEVIPGDPASYMLGVNARPDTLKALKAELGLNTSKVERYLSWILGIIRGDFGLSYTYKTPVADLISERLWVSIPLALYALLLTIMIAIPAGLVAASHQGTRLDTGISFLTQLGISIPNFWFAMILVLIFAIHLQWVNAGGFVGWNAGVWSGLKSLTLPAIALALPQAAILTRLLRSSVLDVLDEDYIRTARAKGLSRSQTLVRHAFRNALIPIITLIGLQFSFLLAGAIIIEQVFYLPGLGRLIFQAISARDLIVVEGAVLLLVCAIIGVNFIIDLLYALIDPRVRSTQT